MSESLTFNAASSEAKYLLQSKTRTTDTLTFGKNTRSPGLLPLLSVALMEDTLGNNSFFVACHKGTKGVMFAEGMAYPTKLSEVKTCQSWHLLTYFRSLSIA